MWLGSDPGPAPMATGRPYEGMLSVENDDASSARIGALLQSARHRGRRTPVRGTPIPGTSTGSRRRDQLKLGLEPLRRVLNLLDELEVLILLGEDRGAMLADVRLDLPDDTGWATVLVTDGGTTTPTSTGTNAERKARRDEQAEVFLRGSDQSESALIGRQGPMRLVDCDGVP